MRGWDGFPSWVCGTVLSFLCVGGASFITFVTAYRNFSPLYQPALDLLGILFWPRWHRTPLIEFNECLQQYC